MQDPSRRKRSFCKREMFTFGHVYLMEVLNTKYLELPEIFYKIGCTQKTNIKSRASELNNLKENIF